MFMSYTYYVDPFSYVSYLSLSLLSHLSVLALLSLVSLLSLFSLFPLFPHSWRLPDVAVDARAAAATACLTCGHSANRDSQTGATNE